MSGSTPGLLVEVSADISKRHMQGLANPVTRAHLNESPFFCYFTDTSSTNVSAGARMCSAHEATPQFKNLDMFRPPSMYWMQWLLADPRPLAASAARRTKGKQFAHAVVSRRPFAKCQHFLLVYFSRRPNARHNNNIGGIKC
jgi:hypothetical protein